MNLIPHVAATLILASAYVWAQQPPAGGPPMQPQRPDGPHGDMMAENFFPPELIMQHQKALGLKEDQQTAIRSEMQKMLSRFTDLQWQQSAENETMASLLKQDHPDEKQVLQQLDKLLKIEDEIKRLHVGLRVKIKNVLTPDQQEQLRELKRQGRPRMPGPGGGPVPHPANPPAPSPEGAPAR